MNAEETPETEPEPVPIFPSEFKVYNETEEYYDSTANYYWRDADEDPDVISILSNKTVI